MKKINKIAVILVALVAVVISGCGADEKNAPTVNMDSIDENEIRLHLTVPTYIIDIQGYDKKVKATKKWAKNFKLKEISLEGKRPCKILGYSDNNDYRYDVKLSGGCPPKDRLNTKSFKAKLKTSYGTFCYDTSDKKSYDSDGRLYKSVSCNK